MKFLLKSKSSIVLTSIMVCITLAPLLVSASLPGHDKRQFTNQFVCPDNIFVNSYASGANNRFFPLVIGSENLLSNQRCVDDGDCDELEEVLINVTNEEELVGTVLTRIVVEFEWVVEGDETIITEVSYNYFAECQATGDVFYFGEQVDNYNYDEEGQVISIDHEGSWRADDVGAAPGIIMPGSFLLGSRYFQEVAPGVALDRGENVAMGLNIDVPGGTFTNCVQINDTNVLEDPKGKQIDVKMYCPGKGIVKDEELELH